MKTFSLNPDIGTGVLTIGGNIQEMVFLRYRNSVSSCEQERNALLLIQQHGKVAAPAFIGMLQTSKGTTMFQSYLNGVDLASLLSYSDTQPPLPPTYAIKPFNNVGIDLATAMEDLGT